MQCIVGQQQGSRGSIDLYLQAGDLHFSTGEHSLQVGQVTLQTAHDEISLGQGGVPLRYGHLEIQAELVRVGSVRSTYMENNSHYGSHYVFSSRWVRLTYDGCMVTRHLLCS